MSAAADAPVRQPLELHAHTTCSDGLLRPAELIDMAQSYGLRTLAVTDHDTTAGFDEARLRGERAGVRVLPGLELTCGVGEREVHVLGYLVDPAHAPLQEATRRIREDRHARMRAMLAKLAAAGAPLSEVPGAESLAPTRAHVARRLIAEGYARDVADAFERLLGEGCVAYVAKVLLPASEAIALIHAAGGVAVLAHPGRYAHEPDLEALCGWGLDGLEVYYPSHGAGQVERYAAEARARGLLATGGSDFHGPGARVELGRQPVPPGTLEALLARRPRPAP